MTLERCPLYIRASWANIRTQIAAEYRCRCITSRTASALSTARKTSSAARRRKRSTLSERSSEPERSKALTEKGSELGTLALLLLLFNPGVLYLCLLVQTGKLESLILSQTGLLKLPRALGYVGLLFEPQ